MKAFIAFVSSCLAISVLTAAEPAPLTKMRIKEVPEKQYFCAKKEVKITEVGEFAMENVPALARKATELKLGQNGPLIMSYIGYKGDPAESFTAEAGFPAARRDDDYRGSFYFRTAPKFKCASVIYQGPVSGTGDAWKKLVDETLAAGHQPIGESREVFLNWESADSDNNIIELQLGIQ